MAGTASFRSDTVFATQTNVDDEGASARPWALDGAALVSDHAPVKCAKADTCNDHAWIVSAGAERRTT